MSGVTVACTMSNNEESFSKVILALSGWSHGWRGYSSGSPMELCLERGWARGQSHLTGTPLGRYTQYIMSYSVLYMYHNRIVSFAIMQCAVRVSLPISLLRGLSSCQLAFLTRSSSFLLIPLSGLADKQPLRDSGRSLSFYRRGGPYTIACVSLLPQCKMANARMFP